MRIESTKRDQFAHLSNCALLRSLFHIIYRDLIVLLIFYYRTEVIGSFWFVLLVLLVEEKLSRAGVWPLSAVVDPVVNLRYLGSN